MIERFACPGLVLLAVFTLGIATHGVASDYYVDANTGRDVGSAGERPESPWKTIAYAIENAHPSVFEPAIIHIGPGTYSPTANGETLPLRPRSNVFLVGWSATSTVIDSESCGSVIECEDAAGIVVQGLTLTGARSRAIDCQNSDVLVRSCIVTGNRRALRSWGSLVQVERTCFDGNEGPGKIVDLFSGHATIRNCRMVNNDAEILVCAVYGHLEMSGCVIENNAGEVLSFVDLEAAITNCFIAGNTSERPGTFNHSIIDLLASSAVFNDCIIEDNQSSYANIMVGLRATGSGEGQLILDNCLITGNISQTDHLIRSYVDSEHCLSGTFSMAQPESDSVSGLVSVDRCTISDNEGNANCLMYNWHDWYVRDTALWNNSGTLFKFSSPGRDVLDVDHCCLQEEFEGEGNFVADPIFASGPLGDYYLSSVEAGQEADSLCIDAGSTSASIAGVNWCTTRTDGAFDSGLVDIGYHYPATPPTIEASIAGAGASPLHGELPRLIGVLGGIMPWTMADRALVPGEALSAQVTSGGEKSRHLVAAAGATRADEGPVLGPGDTLRAQVTVANDGWPIWVDFYAGFVGADGTVFYITPEGLTTDFTAYAIDVLLDEGLHFGPASVFEFTLNEHVAPGDYLFAAALSRAREPSRPISSVATVQFRIM